MATHCNPSPTALRAPAPTSGGLLALAHTWHERAVADQRRGIAARIRTPSPYHSEFWAAVDYLADKGWTGKSIAAQLHTLPEWKPIKFESLTRAINRHLQRRRRRTQS